MISEDKTALKQIHPKHLFNSLRGTAAFSNRTIRCDIGYPFLPWNDFKESISIVFSRTVFQVADGSPLHFDAQPFPDTLIIPDIVVGAYHDLFSVSLCFDADRFFRQYAFGLAE